MSAKSSATTLTSTRPAETRNLTADEQSASAIEDSPSDWLNKPATGLSITITSGRTQSPVPASSTTLPSASHLETVATTRTLAAVSTTTPTPGSLTLAMAATGDAVERRRTMLNFLSAAATTPWHHLALAR